MMTFDNVSVLLGNGDGSFQKPVTYPTGDGPHSVAIGDLNGSEKPDFGLGQCESKASTDNVSILLGNGDGRFEAQRFRHRWRFQPLLPSETSMETPIRTSRCGRIGIATMSRC